MNTKAAGAIPEDVLENEENPSISGLRNAREIAMEQIELANLARFEHEAGIKVDPIEDPKPANLDDAPADPAPEPANPEPAEPAAKVVKVKVDGEEKVVTEDELIRTYQKNRAADRRLEEAAQILREANELQSQLNAQIQAPAAAADPVPTSVDPSLQAEVKETLSVIYSGDEEAAAAALTKLLSQNRGGQVPTPKVEIPSVDAIANAVQERLEFDTAFDRVKTDYPDILADPNLERLTAMKITDLVNAGTPRAQALIDAAEDIYKSLGKKPTGRQVETQTTSPTAQRAANKERLDIVRPASSTAVEPTIPAEEADPSSVIAEMAQRRLGQSLPRRTG